MTLAAAQKRARPTPPRTARDYMYALLLVALAPLIWSVFQKEDDLGQRLERTVAIGSKQVQAKLEEVKNELQLPGPLPNWVVRNLPDDFYAELPAGKIQGAMLSRGSFAHWPLALLSGAAYFALIVFLFAGRAARKRDVLLTGLFTGTIGILLLAIVQILAEATRGLIPIGGLLSLPIWVLKIIGGSYDAALDPSTSFFVSWFGFTVGVGMLEELCKAIPLVWHCHHYEIRWRTACLWGLASGVGFGVAEGISYSGSFYNGIDGGGVYLVRFLSCVALHAVWTSSVGIMIYQQRKMFDEARGVVGYFNTTFSVIAVAMLLHGFYDTFLKKDLEPLALLTALVSFAVLAFQIEHMRRKETRSYATAAV